MDNNKVHLHNQQLEIPKLVTQRNVHDIISYFQRFMGMGKQDILRQEVEKIALLITQEKLIEIIKMCYGRSDTKSSDHKRLCGILFAWITKEESKNLPEGKKFNFQNWIEKNLNIKGATEAYRWRKIVDNWAILEDLAKSPNENAYTMAVEPLYKLLPSKKSKNKKVKIVVLTKKLKLPRKRIKSYRSKLKLTITVTLQVQLPV